MRDRLLIYALAVSISVHLVLLVLVGKTSAAKPIALERLKIVRVDLVKTPDQAKISQDKPDSPKPKGEEPKPEVPYVPPLKRMVVDTHPPKPRVERDPNRRHDPPVQNPKSKIQNPKSSGDPGGPLRGITAPNGEDLGYVPGGNTPSGYVPGDDNGRGIGSGSGRGIGGPEPDPDARPGPGLEPAPPPPPPPPPPPRMVDVSVCPVSGLLPGAYCERKEERSFRDGSEPRRTCSICKAPEPKFVSTHATWHDAELVKDCQPKIPPLDEPGDYTVRIRYTVGTDGSVSDIEITESSGIPAIDRAVRDAARQMRYKPAVQNGEARSVKVKRKYRIRI